MIEFSSEVLNDPFDSQETFFDLEWAVDAENGVCPSCCNIPAPLGLAADDLRAEESADLLADIWERFGLDLSPSKVTEAITAIREIRSELEALSLRPHIHLKVWGHGPTAAPRYYEVPFR